MKAFLVKLSALLLVIMPLYTKATNDPETLKITENELTNSIESSPPSPSDVTIKDPEPYNSRENNEKILLLQLRSSIFSNQGAGNTTTNSTSNANTGTTASTDTVFYNDVGLQATSPRFGFGTRLAAGIGGSFIRFFDGTGFNTLNANAGILQELGQNMSAEVGWRHRTSYGVGDLSDLTENTPRFALRRRDRLDWISPELFLDADYELQANFADQASTFNVMPRKTTSIDRSRLSNFFRLGLSYNFTEKWQGSLSYRLANDNYRVFGCNTKTNCDFTRHEFNTSLTYYFRPNIFASASASYITGDNLNLLPEKQALIAPTLVQNLDFVTFGLTIGADFSLF